MGVRFPPPRGISFSSVVGVSLLILLPAINTAWVSSGQAAVRAPVDLGNGDSRLTGPTESSSVLSAAIRTLNEGLGPAGGSPMRCTTLSYSGSCSSVALPARPTPALTPAGPVLPSSASPPARYGAAIAIYMASGTAHPTNVLLFGGANSSGHVFNDTWVFIAQNTTWVNVTPYLTCTASSCPSARHDAAGGFYSVGSVGMLNQTIIFGGCTVSSPSWTQSVPGCDTSSSHILGDTWEFRDPSPGWRKWNWTKLNTTISPSSRYAASISVGPDLASLILFGGCGAGSSCPLNDTWRFYNSNWTDLNITGPPARYGAALGVAKMNLSVGNDALFGGCSKVGAGCASGGTSGALQDTWDLYQPYAWHLVDSATSCRTKVCPTPRYYPASASYFSPSQLLVYGGIGPGGVVLGNLSDNGGGGWWSFDGSSGVWTELHTPPGTATGEWTGPAPVGPVADRYDTAVVSGDNLGTILFGGSSESGSSLGDTWLGVTSAATVNGLGWPPPAPSPAYGSSMTYDGTDTEDVLFGGCSAECGNISTWTYSPTSTASSGLSTPWQSLAPTLNQTNSPAARMNSSIVYFTQSGSHPYSEVILFGGMASNGSLLNDTWTFTAASGWSHASVYQNHAPTPRQAAAFAFNSTPASPYALLFGGSGSSGVLGDTWLLTYNSAHLELQWTLVSLSYHPASRYGASLAYDVNDKLMVLFGGCGLTCPLGDTWIFTDSPAANWTQCKTGTCAGASAPSARWGAAITYDSTTDELVMFGGCGATCPLGDTWIFSMSALHVRWSQPTVAQTPPARYDAVLADQPTGDYVVLDGGVGSNAKVLGGPGYDFYLPGPPAIGYTWETASSLNEIPIAPAITPGIGATIAYDSVHQVVLLFGGCQYTLAGSNCGPLAGKSYTWLYSNGTWSEACSSCGPTPRWDAGFVFDGAMSEFVLFGGCEASSNSCSSGTVLGDTWTYSYSSRTWTQLTLATLPPSRGDSSMAYDTTAGEVVLFGGIGCTTVCSDTWTFSSSTWTKWTGAGPTARFGSAMSWNPNDLNVVMFGGMLSGGTLTSDTWTFTPGVGWTQLHGPSPVAALDAHTMLLPNGSVLLIGGASSAGTPLDYAWLFNGTAWGASSLTLPTILARWGAGAVFDPAAGANGMGILFGGAFGPESYSSGTLKDASPGQGDTWSYLVNPVAVNSAAYYDVSMFS